MEFHNTSSWLQHSPTSQHVADPLNAHHEVGGSLAADNWKDSSTLTATSTPTLANTVQTGLDLSDFTLDDLNASTSSPSLSAGSSTQPYFATFPANSVFFSSNPGPYNAIPYNAWSTTQQATQLPLSSYSSLNGATSSSESSSAQLHQQAHTPQHTQQPMMIDPALTSMNGSSSNGQHYSQVSSYPLQSSQQPSQPSYNYQHLHSPALSIDPAFMQSSHFFQTSLQQTSPQGTLSPHALHSPSNLSTPGASSSKGQASSSKPEDAEIRKAHFLSAIRPMLQPNCFTGAGAVHTLVSQIVDYGSSDVDAVTRMEILTKIRDNAGNHYFRAWAENTTAIDITRDWLKAGFNGKGDAALAETVMPLLHIIDRLPLTIESLKTSKLGKIVVKLVKDPPAPAIKDMASNLERKWRQLIDEVNPNSSEDAKTKKRKPSEPPPKSAPPTKKPNSVVSLKAVKKETKPVVTAVKDAKSDSSFFSAPKPKAKLPSFKKAPVKKEPEPQNVAQPSAINPFQEALKSMTRWASSTPPPTSATPSVPASTSNAPAKPLKKRKSVKWAPDNQLESIKLIERAVYDDDPVDGVHQVHSLRDLDRGEGAALHAHLFEEAIDWADPILLEFPPDLEGSLSRGSESQEKVTQEEREQTALGAIYMSPAHIPDSPAEPSSVIPEEQADRDVKRMTCGPELDIVFWSGPPVPANQTVADLVSQLSASTSDSVSAAASSSNNGQATPGFDLKALGLEPNAIAALQNLPPEHFQMFQQFAQQQQQQLAQQGIFDQTAQPSFGGLDQNWNANQYSEYGQGYVDDRDRRWADGKGRGTGRGRGRGRGRGNDEGFRSSKRKPCTFFAVGRCKYGDQCDFIHEGVGGATSF